MSSAGVYLDRTEDGYIHWCPGCDAPHHIWTDQRNGRGAIWGFDGNVDKPSFTPSVRISGTQRLTDDDHARLMRGEKVEPRPYCCHYFITEGEIHFCGDCTHSLAGKNLPLPPLPREL